MKKTYWKFLIAFVLCVAAVVSIAAVRQDDVWLFPGIEIFNNGTLKIHETRANGTSKLIIAAPASLAADTTLTMFDSVAATIADGANGGAYAVYTISSPSKDFYAFTCSDTDGCRIEMSETGAVTGMRLTLMNVGGSNDVVITEADAQVESAGNLTLSQDHDAVNFIYEGDRWVQLSAVVNN